jgi:CRP-like cAMP-binding protein
MLSWGRQGAEGVLVECAILELALPEVRAAVRARMRSFRVPKGRTVIGAASASENVFFVEAGEMQALLYSPNGKEVSVRQIDAGEMFGELAALDGLPRATTVIALTEARLIEMARRDFLMCIETSPRAATWLARRLAAEVRRLTERMFELSALNVSARLHCELLRLAKLSRTDLVIEPAPTHAELANRIGSHREAVTREMHFLADRMIVSAQRRRLTILDLPQLEYIVGQAMGELFASKTMS